MENNALLAQARARFDHESNRRILREKYLAKMIFAHAGGLWQAGPELLAVLAVATQSEMVLSDLYGNPVMVQRDELRGLAEQRWQEQMRAWLIEYQENSRNR